MLPVLLATAMTLAPLASVTTDTTVTVLGDEVRLQGAAHGGGAWARGDSAAGWQVVYADRDCALDTEGACETVVDCQPDTANCWASRHPIQPWPCTWVPDDSEQGGHWVCDPDRDPPPADGPPAEQPVLEAPDASCGDVFADGVCALAPQEGDSPNDACRRLLAPPRCVEPPAPPTAAEACREVFAERVCAAAGE